MLTFDSTKRSLVENLADIVKGKIQLLDLQRGWVWDDDHIRSLLVGIARSFPVEQCHHGIGASPNSAFHANGKEITSKPI